MSRINRELQAGIDVSAFEHYPYYDPVSGNCLSFLISLEKQTVYIDNEAIHFKKNELIHTEISKKYGLNEIKKMSSENGFIIEKHFLDFREYYSLCLLRRDE